MYIGNACILPRIAIVPKNFQVHHMYIQLMSLYRLLNEQKKRTLK